MYASTSTFLMIMNEVEKNIGEKHERVRYDNITETRFALDLANLLKRGDWYVKKDKGEEIILSYTDLVEESVKQHFGKNITLRYPNSITKEWLETKINISNDILERFSKFNNSFVADQLIKNADKGMMIPLREINILGKDEWNKLKQRKRNNNCGGFAEFRTGKVYINFDYEDEINIWSVICHELRHIGLESNPVYWYCSSYEREEFSVEKYGMSAGLYHNWDDSWMESGGN